MPKQRWLALTVPSILVVFALWLPFGFALSGLIEEWGVLGLFANQGLFFVADASGPLAAHRLRPLTVLPHALAYFIDPNSFDYWHVLLLLALVLKGGAASYLALKTTRSMSWAMVMGVLVLVYPADTMQLSFRGLHINLSLALLLLAASVQIAAYEQQRRWISGCFGLVAASLLLVSILMYESAFALMPLPFLIMYVRIGFRQTWRSVCAKPELAFSWVAALAVFVGYVLLTTTQGTSYQSDIVASRGPIDILYAALPKLFSIGMVRGLLGGWLDAAGMVKTEFSNYTYLILASLACAALIGFRRKIFYGNYRDDSVTSPLNWKPIIRLELVGILLLLLGYAPYLFSNAHLAISQRTFLFATVGAAFMWLAVLMVLKKLVRWLAVITGLGLLFFGLGAQLFQFHHYVEIAATQRSLLRSIVENFDGNLSRKTLVILDGSNRLNHTWMLRDSIPGVLSYLYERPIKSVEICLMPSGSWQRFDSLARMGKCVESKEHWTFKPATAVAGPGLPLTASPPNFTIAKDDVITLTINADSSISSEPTLNAYRTNLQRGTDDSALRYRHILARKPWPVGFGQFQDREAQDHYRWDFGKWWSMELPIHGSGWREAEWQINYFRHNASAWKSQEQSSLLFDLTPTAKVYRVDGQFDVILNQAIKNSLRIRLNGQELTHQWGIDGRFQAKIPAGLLISGSNTIEFNSATDPNYYGLSAKLDWFEVRAD